MRGSIGPDDERDAGRSTGKRLSVAVSPQNLP